MAAVGPWRRELSGRILKHLLARIAATPAIQEPFTHIYLEEVFPPDLYELLLRQLPDPAQYTAAAERYRTGDAGYVRSMFALTPAALANLATQQQELWAGVAAALTAPELKQAMFAKLAKDLAFRYGVAESAAGELVGHARPTLYRETEGFEIPPHPDTRKKVVTMHLYWPADRSQLDLGTALYRRKLLAWPFGGWQHRFEMVKQFLFQPNSGYAFVVNNALTKKSWHGRERLRPDAGARNTLLNTFYESRREEFEGYLDGKEPLAA
jgi:hypothetical protein